MSQVRHTQVLDTATRWLGRLVDQLERGPVERQALHSQLSSLTEALLTTRADLLAREKVVIAAESRIEDASASDRIDALYAERMMKDAGHALERLSLFGLNHADRAQTRVIRRDTQAVLDGLEALALGVGRPQPTHHTENHNPDIGA